MHLATDEWELAQHIGYIRVVLQGLFANVKERDACFGKGRATHTCTLQMLPRGHETTLASDVGFIPVSYPVEPPALVLDARPQGGRRRMHVVALPLWMGPAACCGWFPTGFVPVSYWYRTHWNRQRLCWTPAPRVDAGVASSNAFGEA